MSSSDVVLLAHGSPDPRHARDVEELVCRVAAADAHQQVRAAYLDHHAPSVADLGAELAPGSGVITLVPLLLTAAFHVRVDVPAAAAQLTASTGRPVRTTAALGPDPLVAQAISELLDQRSEAQVLIYLAGSSQTEAVDELIASLHASLPPERRFAVATLDEYRPLAAALRDLGGTEGVVGVSAMIADGVLRDRMVARCAAHGIPFADGVLARTDALARLVAGRIAG